MASKGGDRGEGDRRESPPDEGVGPVPSPKMRRIPDRVNVPARTRDGQSDIPDEGDSDSPSIRRSNVPPAAVRRMMLYHRELQHLIDAGVTQTNSRTLAKMLRLKDAQVRRDLSHLGRLGYPGVGYQCSELIAEIQSVLGIGHLWRVALLGAGHLGQALLGYRGFVNQGFEITDAFDNDPAKIGSRFGKVHVHAMTELSRIVRERQIGLAILAVPAAEAPEIASVARASGVRGLLNFAPIALTPGDDVEVIDIDLAVQLRQLAFKVVKQPGDG